MRAVFGDMCFVGMLGVLSLETETARLLASHIIASQSHEMFREASAPARQARLRRVLVEVLEHLLDLGKLRLRLRDGGLELLAALLLGDVLDARLVLLGAKVLDLLARVLYFCEAKRGRGALEKVAELTKRLEVVALLLLPVARQHIVRSGGCV